MTAHIVIITAVFDPEPVVSARMGSDLAAWLASRSYAVTVICPQPSRPLNADYREYVQPGAQLIARDAGLTIIRLPSHAAPRSRLFDRMRESASFGLHARNCLASLNVKPDVLYVNSWPLFGQSLIVDYAKRSGIPLVLQIMDIYPEAMLGKLPFFLRKPCEFVLRGMDSRTAHGATHLSVLTHGMRDTYIKRRNLPVNRISVIATWQDESLFAAPGDRSAACVRYGVPGNRFTFMFLGNIGPVAAVGVLIKAFHKAGPGSWQLLIVGDGSEKASCKELVTRLGVADVRFISDPDAANVPILQSMADVCLLPMKHGSGLSSIPSKLTAYMLSAKPVIAMADPESDTVQTIRQAQCGWPGMPEDTDWLATKMKEVRDMPREHLRVLGENGRQYAIEHFSKSRGVQRLARVILGLLPEAMQPDNDMVGHR